MVAAALKLRSGRHATCWVRITRWLCNVGVESIPSGLKRYVYLNGVPQPGACPMQLQHMNIFGLNLALGQRLI